MDPFQLYRSPFQFYSNTAHGAILEGSFKSFEEKIMKDLNEKSIAIVGFSRPGRVLSTNRDALSILLPSVFSCLVHKIRLACPVTNAICNGKDRRSLAMTVRQIVNRLNLMVVGCQDPLCGFDSAFQGWVDCWAGDLPIP